MATTAAPVNALWLGSVRSAVHGDAVVVTSIRGVSSSCAAKRRGYDVKCNLRVDREERSDSSADESLVNRRSALALLAGGVALSAKVAPASAAYGEAAKVFGTRSPDTGFVTYSGNGFKVKIPSKWNPSKEVEFPGQVLRYEDNVDSLTMLSVNVVSSSKSSIADYGSPEQFLKEVSFMLGKQSYTGKTVSEGGFDPNAVAAANILESASKEVDGKKYYYVSVLTRTADGDEGGKHQIIVATVSGGKLYILKSQAGDKRWFKGTKKYVEGVASSFNVA